MKKLLLSLFKPLDRILWNWMCTNKFILFTLAPTGFNPTGIDTGPGKVAGNWLYNWLNKNSTNPNDDSYSDVMGLFRNPITGESGTIGTVEATEITYEADRVPDVLYYPKGLDNNANRPQIRFNCFEQSPESNGVINIEETKIFFPAPANIAFADQGNYNALDLGVFGDFMNDVKGAELASASRRLVEGLGKNVGFEKAVDVGLFAAKQVANPFQNTSFQGNAIRTFTFNFKMIARNADEAREIKKIHTAFRLKTYAQKANANTSGYLKYPPVWQIDFLMGHNATGFQKNPYVPEINLCYLTTLNTTFNTTAAAWTNDGAPIEVDVSLTFQESRANERQDIANMNNAALGADLLKARNFDKTKARIEGVVAQNNLN